MRATRRPSTRQARRHRERSRRHALLRERIPEPVKLWSYRTIAVIIAVAALWASWAYRPIPIPAAPQPIRTSLEGYRVMYKVTDTAGDSPIVSTEVVEIRRPFESRSETWKGYPPESVQFGSVTNRMYFYNLKENGQEAYGVVRTPGTASRDGSYAAVTHGVAEGLARRVGTARVLGEKCVRFLHKNPYPEPLTLPTSRKERVITCMTPQGIMLREDWWLSGRIVRVREAVELSRTPPPADRFFAGRKPAQTQAAALVAKNQQVAENKAQVSQLARPRVLPPGFALDRKATVTDSGGDTGPSRITYQESYRRGNEVVTIVQGETPTGKAPWDVKQGEPVTVQLGRARAITYLDHVELRVAAGTNFIRINAPSYDLAFYFARTLKVR